MRGAFRGAVFGGISAGLANGVGHGFDGAGGIGAPGSLTRALAHGVSQGAVAVLRGGKFGAGFISSFASSVAAPIIKGDYVLVKSANHAILGGTISKLVGGKFANGAISGAFVYMFNDLVGISKKSKIRPGDKIGLPYWGKEERSSPWISVDAPDVSHLVPHGHPNKVLLIVLSKLGSLASTKIAIFKRFEYQAYNMNVITTTIATNLDPNISNSNSFLYSNTIVRPTNFVGTYKTDAVKTYLKVESCFVNWCY